MTPPASAHDGYRYHQHRSTWSDSTAYRRPYYGRSNDYYGQYNDWESRRAYSPPQAYRGNSQKYNKAMNRLSRQEREAREKAARRYEGDYRDPRYRERLSEIDRRYDHKRDKVERNLRYD